MSTAGRILPLAETVTPTDQAGVAQAIGNAFRSRTPVYPIGGGTGLRYGVRPTQPGLGLSLAKLSGLVDYPARDLTITVEAGMTVAELTRRLASEGQRLPVDLPYPGRATIGGAVATNASGPRRHRWGGLRDYVLGLRAVDGRGTAFSAGGRVVKNAAGYNLCRLMTGSLGTLAVVTQVTLMIKPVPETSAWSVCDLPDWNATEPLLAALVKSQTLPSAVEALAGPAWEDDPALGPPSTSHAVRLAVGFEGARSEVDWMLERIRQEWAGLGVTPPAEVRSGAAEKLWDRLREFTSDDPEAAAEAESAPVVIAIHTLPSALAATADHVCRIDPGCSIQAHAGEGVVRVRFSLPADEVAPVLDARLRQIVASGGGSITVTSCPDRCRFDRQMIWGPPVEDGGAMQAIKQQFDPEGILNRGRYVFG